MASLYLKEVLPYGGTQNLSRDQNIRDSKYAVNKMQKVILN